MTTDNEPQWKKRSRLYWYRGALYCFLLRSHKETLEFFKFYSHPICKCCGKDLD